MTFRYFARFARSKTLLFTPLELLGYTPARKSTAQDIVQLGAPKHVLFTAL